jgi:hypothetical protein
MNEFCHLDIFEIILRRLSIVNVVKMTQLALKGGHKVIPCTSSLEKLLIHVGREIYSIGIQHLRDRELYDATSFIAIRTPCS